MTLSCSLQKFHGDYSTLFTPNGGWLSFDFKKGWKIIRTPVTSKTHESYFSQLISNLLREDLKEIVNPECLVFRINQVWNKYAQCRYENNSQEDICFNSKAKGYDYLSNFSPTLILINGELFSSAEHAYQKLKVEMLDPQRTIGVDISGMSALEIKKWGAGYEESFNLNSEEKAAFDVKKLDLMRMIVEMKYRLNQVFRDALIKTAPHQLVENTDSVFWGCGRDGKRQNHLGLILEEVRKGCLVEGAVQ